MHKFSSSGPGPLVRFARRGEADNARPPPQGRFTNRPQTCRNARKRTGGRKGRPYGAGEDAGDQRSPLRYGTNIARSCLPLRGNCGFALPVAGFRLRAASGRRSVTGISAAAPLAGRCEAGPPTAFAARRSKAMPQLPQRSEKWSKRTREHFSGYRKADGVVRRLTQAGRRKGGQGAYSAGNRRSPLRDRCGSRAHRDAPLRRGTNVDAGRGDAERCSALRRGTDVDTGRRARPEAPLRRERTDQKVSNHRPKSITAPGPRKAAIQGLLVHGLFPPRSGDGRLRPDSESGSRQRLLRGCGLLLQKGGQGVQILFAHAGLGKQISG